MKNSSLSKVLKALFGVLLLSTVIANAQTKRVLANWMGGNASSISFPYNGDYSNPITNGCSMNYSGITPQNDGRFFFTANASSTLNTSTSPYISFTINAGSSSIDLDRIVFQSYAGASLNTSLRYSVDGYASNLGSITANGSSYSLTSVNLNTLANITGTVEFRVYFYGNSTATSIYLGNTGSAYSSVDGTPSSYGPTAVAPPTGYSWSSVSFWYNLPPEVPKITNFSPKSGPVGTSVTITGSGFDTTAGNNVVYFGGVKALVTSATATQLVVTSPVGGSGKISVSIPSSNLNVVSNFIYSNTYSGSGYTINSCSFPLSNTLNISSTIKIGTNWYDQNFNPITAADFNNDGKIDLAKVNGSSSTKGVDVYLNSSNGIGNFNFNLGQNLSSTLSFSTVISGDFNGDGKIDIAASDGSTTTFYKNTTSGTTLSFDAGISVSSSGVSRLQSGDVNGDGKLDLLYVGNYASGVGLLLNTSSNGNVSFNSGVTYFSGLSGARGFGVGDVNNDGKVDVFIGHEGGQSGVYISTSTSSTISAPTNLVTTTNLGPYMWGISSLVDINNDGKIDLVKTTGSDAALCISENTFTSGTIAASNFLPKVLPGGNATVIHSLDLNGDGKIDMVYFDNLYSDGIKAITNTTSGTIAASGLSTNNIYTSVAGSWEGLLGDFDLDGRNDVISFTPGSVNSTLRIFKNSLPPLITTSGTINAFVACAGTASAPQTIDVSGQNLTSAITLTAPTNFEISLSSASGYAASLTLTPTSGSVSATTIYIRTKSTASGTLSGNLTLAATCTTTQSIAVSGTVNAVTAISAHPSTTAQSVCQGTALTALSVTASGTSLTYQWYSNTTASTTGSTLITGATSASYTPVNSSPSALYYYCVVTGTCGTVTSNISALRTVSATPVAGTAAASATSICTGSTSTLSLTGSTGTIQWQSSPNNSTWTNISGATSASYTTPALTTTTYYRAQISSGNCTTINSTALTVTVNPVPTITLATTAAIVPSATTFSIPYSAITNSPNTYSVSSGTNALANFVPIIDATFSGATGSLAVAIPANSAPGTYDFNLKVKNGTTSCESVVYPVSVTILQAAPTITSFSPTSATVGTQVIITGTGFSSTPANNVVFFGATRAVVSAATTTSLTVTVPSGATHSNLVVLNSINSLIGMSNNFFTPIFTPSRANILSTDYAPRVSFAGVRAAQYIAVGDLDGDGKPDLAIGHNTPQNVITVYRNTSSAGIVNSSSFAAAVNISVGSYPGALSLGDLDGDGKLDIVVCNGNSSNISILRNISTVGSISTSSFSPAVNYTTGTAPINVALRDIDNDGKLDITVANKNSNSISIFKNNSSIGVINSNSFLPKIDLTTPSAPYCVTYGDLDGDGKSELISSNGASGSISVYRNISTQGIISANSFDAKFDITTGVNPRMINLVDIDGDGKLDITVTNNGSNTLSIIKNISTTGSLSSSSFQVKVDFSTGTQPYGITAGDINGDGKPELAVANVSSNTISVYKNTTSNSTVDINSLATKVDFPTVYNPNAVIIADLDSENRPELIYTNYNDSDVSQNVSILKFNNFEVLGALNQFNACAGSPSAAQTLTIQGSNLTANIIVAALTGYEFSLDGITYSSTVTIVPVSGTVAATTLYIRLTGVTVGSPSGTISITCLGTTTQTRVVTGSVNSITAISAHPSTTAQSVCQGTALTALSVTASGTSLTYQWYSNTTASTTGSTLITGATSASYTPVNSTPSELYYYCVVTGTCGTVTSNISALRTVSATPVAGTAAASATSICSGSTSTLSLTGSTGNIQWQSSPNNSTWTNISGATSASYTTPALTTTTYYRAQISSGNCTTINSTALTVTVTAVALPTATTSIALCEGDTAAQITATAASGHTLQWYTVATGGTASTTAPTPSTSSAGSTTYYVSQLNNTSNCESARVAITVTVYALPSAPTATTTINYCQGATATALSATALSGHTLQWYTVASAGTASTTAPIPVTSSIGSTTYYVSQKNNTTSCEGPRTAITVAINANPSMTGAQNMTVGGSTLQLTGSGTPDATTPWTSSNTAVATISASGEVTAVAGGNTTITYTNASGCSITAVIRVVDCAQPFGNALAFGVGTNASNADYVQVNSRIFPSQTVANFTIETWIKPSASDIIAGTPGNSWLAFLGYSGTKRSPSLYITNNGVLHASWSEGATLNGTPVSATSTSSLTQNKWTHVALVKDGTTMRLFVDGVQIHALTCLANLDIPDNAYWLGKSDQQFSGALDEVRFWSTARTQSQIVSTMYTELAGNETGLLSYFDFNEGVAGGTNTSITSVTNKVNNTLNGTLTNFTRTGTTSNFVGNTTSNIALTGAATICGNSTSQYTHPVAGGTWSVSSGATATVSNTGLLTCTSNESITLSYNYNINGCSFTATKAIVIDSPAAPVTNATINLCQGATTTALTATALSGHTLQWYTAATGGTASTTAPTPSSATLGSTTYYVSQKNNTTNCESVRTAITVTVNAVPTISGAQSITVGGASLQLTGSGTPDATTPWASSNVAAATVSSTGVVTAVGAGSTIITYAAANGCTATAVISVVDCSQPFGNALQFDGVDDSFSTASNLSALSITGNITLETWIKFDQVHSDYVRIIGKGDSANRTYGLWLGTNGKLLFQIWGSFGSGINLEAITALQPGIWYHISATRNGNTAKIYINGVEDASTSTTVTPQTNSFPLTVGYGTLHTWLKGSLDEVRVWNVARSLSQIQQGMYNALVGNETGLVAYYDFNQGIAGGNNTSIVSALDRTTNVLHGTLINFAKTGTASNFVGNTAANFAITGAATLCANSTSQYTHQVSGGTWSVSNGANATISATGLLTAAANEDITVSYTYVVNGCSFTATRAISINTPAAPVAPATVNLCQGITASALTASATTGNTLQWYTVATLGTASTTAPTPSVATLGTITYYVSQKNTTTNCESTRTAIAVTVNAIPTITGVQNMTVGGTTLQLTGSGTPDATTPWASSNTAVATVSSSGEVTAVAGGTTTITYTSASGCSKTATVRVTDCSSPLGNSMHFDGVDDISVVDNVGNNSNFAFGGTTSFSLETWVKRENTGGLSMIFSKYHGGVAGNYSIGISAAGKPIFFREVAPWSVEAPDVLPVNEWHHIAATYDGSQMKIYVDGVLKNSISSGAVANNVSNIKVHIGGAIHQVNTPIYLYKGELDEIRVWNIARTATQIQQAYKSALQGNEAGLVAYYDFNQGIPAGNNTNITSIINSVNSASNGNLTNFARTGTTSNFLGSGIANLAIAGLDNVCANSTSQFTHPISGGTWSVSNGANATINASGLVTTLGAESITISYLYSVNGCSFTATKTVAIVAPAITAQPSTTAQNVCINGITATIAVTATGSGVTYQWYRNATATNTGGTLISGATNFVLMPSNTLVGTTYYYCVVSSTCSSPITSSVSGAITIAPNSVAGTITGATSICSGATTTLTLSGNVGSVQWQRFDSPIWTDLAGATSTTYTTPALTQNTTYRAVVTSGVCSATNTADFNVAINPLPVISGTTSVSAGESVTLTATTTAASSNAWVSSTPAVASVTNTGVVNGLALGTTTITFTNNNGCTDTEIITVVAGTTQTPTLTLPATNTSGATTLNFNYTLPEAPLAGTVKLIFTPTGGGTPIVWTMNNDISAIFSYVVGTNPSTISNVTSGAALGFTTYNVTLTYQDAFANPSSNTTNTNIQTLAPPVISFVNATNTGVINTSISIATLNTGGSMVTYSIAPTLPSGLSINTATGLISGTPTATLAQTSFTVTATNAAGSDTESFNLFIDADSDGDGIGNTTDPDIDGDGILNGSDVDPDGDGINNNGTDTDGDGINDANDSDIDGDGILNGSDVDPDGDGINNNGTDTDGDGINDANDTDIDGDGIANGSDADPNGDGIVTNGPDTDGDGINDANDPDIDGDGILNGSDSDPDGNGSVNNGPDTDGDGINDANDSDIDGDGISNGADADANGDGTIDNGALDTDGDGILDGADADANGDGIIDNGPDTDGDGVNDTNDSDIDGDGIPNGSDVDPDGDGTNNNGTDTDGDGINDANDSDIDGDGILNGADADVNGDGIDDNGSDTDNDGINDSNDPDIDGDGISNGADADPDGDGVVNNGPDTDGDGINNAADADVNGDGVDDNGTDTDNDGINDANDPDIDGDGIPNGSDVDPDGDGTNNNGSDMDGDGINDANDPDIDGDGLPNGLDNCPNVVNPSVATQPTSQVINICPNATAPTLTVVAEGQQLEYQWYINTTNSNVGGTAITGATNATYVPSNTLVGPRYYYVVISGTCGTAKSNVSGAITVQDITAPTVITQNVSVALTASGTVSITASQVNNGSTDNCGIASVTVSPSTFTCSNVGPNTVTLTVTDANGNIATGTAVVTVTDTTLPVVITQPVTVQLNASGVATITASQVNNGSTDNCSIASVTVSPSTFTCSNVGPNTVTLTVTDANGNIATGTAVVTVTDTTLPVVITQPVTVQLNASGVATITASQINNGSTDNCSIASVTVSPSTFTCSNVGPNTVTLTVTDANGNIATGTAVVTVTETTLPVVITQPVTVQLNASGVATITASQVNNGSTDNCGISSITVSPTLFSCSNVGPNTVTLTVTDTNGNIKTGTAIVTVQDTVLPTVLTQNAAITLNASGTATITASQVNNGSTDNCSIASVTVSPSTFTCANIGANTVTLTVTDTNGNVASGTAIVTVTIDNTQTGNNDLDALPDNCDDDDDNDGILDVNDNCQFLANVDQVDTDNDGIGNSCDNDDDNDNVNDALDNCPLVYNPSQDDRDNDGIGDICDTIEINVSEAITPNGDGINDTWIIYNIENHPNHVIRVYNRFGNEVMFAKNYQNNWDGHYVNKSNTLPSGASYYYQIDLDGNGSIEHEGWLYITK